MMLLLIFLLYAILLSIGLGLAGYRSAPAAPQPEPGEPPTRILVIGATGGTDHLAEPLRMPEREAHSRHAT